MTSRRLTQNFLRQLHHGTTEIRNLAAGRPYQAFGASNEKTQDGNHGRIPGPLELATTR